MVLNLRFIYEINIHHMSFLSELKNVEQFAKTRLKMIKALILYFLMLLNLPMKLSGYQRGGGR